MQCHSSRHRALRRVGASSKTMDPHQSSRTHPAGVAFVPVSEPLLNGNEAAYLTECVDTGWISSEGRFVTRLEEAVAALTEQKHGIAVTNGSAALELAVAALGIGPGDEVIVPTFTIISCAAAVIRAGAIPVVIDSESHTWNLNPDHIEANITTRTKAIMVVHLYGLPVNMDPVVAIARRHGLAIIEDGAQQIGQMYRSASGSEFAIGSFGDVAVFSFYANKHVTTGEGGMVLTSDDSVAQRCRSLRNLCFGKERRFMHESLGWNFRMSNVQAALGVAQLEHLAQTIGLKRQIGAWYEAGLGDVVDLERLPERTAFARNIYWIYGVVLGDQVPFDASEAMKQLSAAGIGTRPFFWPMHEQPVLRRMGLFGDVSCPVAERLARRGFYLPSGVTLTHEQVDQICGALRGVLNHERPYRADRTRRAAAGDHRP
jgi:perosamine synthetase